MSKVPSVLFEQILLERVRRLRPSEDTTDEDDSFVFDSDTVVFLVGWTFLSFATQIDFH